MVLRFPSNLSGNPRSKHADMLRMFVFAGYPHHSSQTAGWRLLDTFPNIQVLQKSMRSCARIQWQVSHMRRKC